MNQTEKTIKEVTEKRIFYWNKFKETKKEYYKEVCLTCIRILSDFEKLKEEEKVVKLEELK